MPTLAELFVVFKGDDSKLSADMDTAKGKMSGFAGNATKLIGGAVAGAAVAAGAAIIGIGTAAFNVSSETAAAASQMAASLGLPIDEAEKFADVARKVYGNNFADSVGDAATAVEALAKQLGMTADDPALQTMTENAFRLRDVFGTDVNESISAVKALTENFGITSEEAFDLLATGYQRGLDGSGDFLDTIGEYSVQFAEGGASAVEFFSAMDTGLQAGVLGTDKAADAFKEFRLRIQDGSTLTADSLAAIGLNAAEITTGLADGTLTVKDTFDMVQRAMITTEDPIARFNAGVGLLGSQYEDLGEKTILAMDLTDDWADGGLESISKLDVKYGSFGDATSAIWRKLVTSVSPYTDVLLDMVNRAMPSVMAAMDNFMVIVDGVMAVISGLITIITGTAEPLGDWSLWWEKLADIFGEDVADAIYEVGDVIDDLRNMITDAFPDAQQAVQTAIDAIIGFFKDKLNPAVEDGTGIFEYFKGWLDTNLPLIQTLFQNVLGAIQGFWDTFGGAITTVIEGTFSNLFVVLDAAMRTIFDIITLALQLLTGDWEGAWETLKGIFERIWETIKTVVSTQLDTFKSLFTDIDWGEIGRNIMQGVIDGIVAMSSALWQAAQTVSQNLWDSMTGWWSISSPSKKAEEGVGKPIAAGIIDGVVFGLGHAKDEIDSAMASLLNSMMGPQYSGGVQAEDGSWVPADFYGDISTGPTTATQSPLAALLESMSGPLYSGMMQAEDGSWVPSGFYNSISTGPNPIVDLLENINETLGLGHEKGDMKINVTVSGDNATFAAGQAVGRGIMDEMRRRGA